MNDDLKAEKHSIDDISNILMEQLNMVDEPQTAQKPKSETVKKEQPQEAKSSQKWIRTARTYFDNATVWTIKYCKYAAQKTTTLSHTSKDKVKSFLNNRRQKKHEASLQKCEENYKKKEVKKFKKARKNGKKLLKSKHLTDPKIKTRPQGHLRKTYYISLNKDKAIVVIDNDTRSLMENEISEFLKSLSFAPTEKSEQQSTQLLCALILLSDDYNLTSKSVENKETFNLTNPKIIFELGRMIERLGRSRVAVIDPQEQNLVRPTGTMDAIYISYSDDQSWKRELKHRLTQCGLLKEKINETQKTF